MGQPLNSRYSAIRAQNPQLLPSFDPITSGVGSDSIDHVPVDVFLASNPRAHSTTAGQVTIGGTITAADTVTLSIENPVFPSTTSIAQNVTVSVTYTVQGGDTVSIIAAQLAALVNSNLTFQQYGFYAVADETAAVILIYQQSGVGAFSTISGSKSAGATETITVNNQIAGGSGPVIPTFNFEFKYNNAVLYFYKGHPVLVGYDLLTALVNQGYPIY